MEAEEPETKKSKTKTKNKVFTNNKPKGCRFHVRNANMGCIRHHRSEPLTCDIKSVCLSSLTISQRATLAVVVN